LLRILQLHSRKQEAGRSLEDEQPAINLKILS